MVGRRFEKSLTIIVAVVCVVMLALIGARLYAMLNMTARSESSANRPFTDDVAADGLPGLVLIDIADDESASSFHVPVPGVYVLAVDESSGAYCAGVRSGDRIVSVNGVAVTLSEELRQSEDGGGLTLVLSRQGETVTVLLDTGSSV